LYLVETFPRRQQNLSSETLNLRIEDSRDEKTELSHIKKDLSSSKNYPNGRAPKNPEGSYLLAFRKITF